MLAPSYIDEHCRFVDLAFWNFTDSRRFEFLVCASKNFLKDPLQNISHRSMIGTGTQTRKGITPMDGQMKSLQSGIVDRQKELNNLVSVLGRKASLLRFKSNAIKSSTIVLSAITTSKGVVDQIAGADYETLFLVVFTVLGIALTALLAIEAAFKFEKRSIDLNMLSAVGQSTVITVDSEWRKKIGSESGSDLRDAARDLLSMQDAKLAEIHQRAAESGLPIVMEIRKLEDPADQPYTA